MGETEHSAISQSTSAREGARVYRCLRMFNAFEIRNLQNKRIRQSNENNSVFFGLNVWDFREIGRKSGVSCVKRSVF